MSLVILRKFWADPEDNDNSQEFAIIRDNKYTSLSEEDAWILLKESLQVVSRLYPLLNSDGLKFYSSDN